MTKAVAYYRVSTDRQGESGLGLEAQQMSVHQYVLANKLSLIKEFTEVESATKNDRPFLKQALAWCRRNRAILVIAKLDRLGSNVAFIASLMESKVNFIAADKPYKDEFMLHIDAVFAHRERKLIGIRTKEALQAAKRKGVKLGKNSAVLAKKNREAAENFARLMKPVIEKLVEEGFRSSRKIARELNRRRVKTFRGKKHKWHENTVRRLLKQIQSIQSKNGITI